MPAHAPLPTLRDSIPSNSGATAGLTFLAWRPSRRDEFFSLKGFMGLTDMWDFPTLGTLQSTYFLITFGLIPRSASYVCEHTLSHTHTCTHTFSHPCTYIHTHSSPGCRPAVQGGPQSSLGPLLDNWHMGHLGCGRPSLNGMGLD